MDFRGFDSSRVLILRVGIPRSVGNFPESLSQAILVGIILVGRFGYGGLRILVFEQKECADGIWVFICQEMYRHDMSYEYEHDTR